jgi:hypothetical protein
MTAQGTADYTNYRQSRRQAGYVTARKFRGPCRKGKTERKADPNRPMGEPMMTKSLEARQRGYDDTIKQLTRLNKSTKGYYRPASESK